MAIHRGSSNIKRVHATNYIGKQAEMRKKEAVAAAQARGLEALKVDKYEIEYFHKVDCSIICTCRKTEVSSSLNSHPNQASNSVPKNMLVQQDGDEEIVIDHANSLFGTKASSSTIYEDEEASADELGFNDEELIEDSGNGSIDSLFGAGVDCGVCYRSGLVPGYENYGKQRMVFTTHVIENAYGYNIDVSATPHKICKMDHESGYIDFILEVPKYFKAVKYSVRNNTNVLKEEILYNASSSLELHLADLRYSAGKTHLIRCKAREFTHLVVEFDLGVDKVIANLSQATLATDFTLFDQFGTVSFILPMTIQEVATQDAIYVPKRKQTFKVTDFTYLRTSENSNIDWLVQTRVVQPQEALKTIHLGNMLND